MIGSPAAARLRTAWVSRFGARLDGTRSENNVDLFDGVAFEDLVDDVEAVEDLGEHGVLVVEARVVDEIDEDLRVTGVVPARRDADRAAHVRPQPDLVAHERRIADVFVRAGAAALDDEVRHDAMERQSVVVALLREPREPRDGHRRFSREQHELEGPNAAHRYARPGAGKSPKVVGADRALG